LEGHVDDDKYNTLKLGTISKLNGLRAYEQKLDEGEIRKK
jgi:hypothetical protein